ncbi:uncharacterized protein [Clytia hemisphaerica]
MRESKKIFAMKITRMIVFFLCFISIDCFDTDVIFDPQKDSKVSSGSQISKPGISVTQCFYGCLTVTRCQGVNYHPSNQHCVLVSEVDDIESQLQNDAGWIFYEKKQNNQESTTEISNDVSIRGEFMMIYGKLLQVIPRFGRVWTLDFDFKLLEEPEVFSLIFRIKGHDMTSTVMKIILVGTNNKEEFLRVSLKPNQSTNLKLSVQRNQIRTGILNQWHKLRVISTIVAFPDISNIYLLFNGALVAMKTSNKLTNYANVLLYHDLKGSQPKILLRDFKFNQTEDILSWDPIKDACIVGNNMKTYNNFPDDINACKEKCEQDSRCKSIDHNQGNNICYISEATALSAPSDYSEPCTVNNVLYDVDYTEITREEKGKLLDLSSDTPLEVLPKFYYQFIVSIKIRPIAILPNNNWHRLYWFVTPGVEKDTGIRIPKMHIKYSGNNEFTIHAEFDNEPLSGNVPNSWSQIERINIIEEFEIPIAQWSTIEFITRFKSNNIFNIEIKVNGQVDFTRDFTITAAHITKDAYREGVEVLLGYSGWSDDYKNNLQVKDFWYGRYDLD